MQTITRTQLLALLPAALGHEAALLHAQDLALAWLRTYPGDLRVRAAYVRLLLRRGQPEAARPIALRLCIQHPLEAQFHFALVMAARQQALAGAVLANTCLHGLGVPVVDGIPVASWGRTLADLRAALVAHDQQSATRALTTLLAASPDTPLLAIAHLQVLAGQYAQVYDETTSLPPVPEVYALLENYRTRWPDCLPLMLWQAELFLTNGQEAEAMALMHRVVVQDAGGDVVRNLWGAAHRYRDLWPSDLRMPLSTPLPLELASLLGWHGLPQGDAGEADDAPGVAVPHGEAGTPQRESARRVFLRGKRPFWQRAAPPAHPVYAILTSREGLEQQYGRPGAQRVLLALAELRDALWARYAHGALLAVVDDEASMAQFGLKAVSPCTPWNIKLALHDVQAALADRQQRIGALLIVGGEQVVPFHRLPNPLDDDDPDVPSDAPYGCADENYFIGQWPVGRLPGDASRRVDVLLAQIAQVMSHQRVSAHGGRTRWARWVGAWVRWWQWLQGEEALSAVGYTAQVWWPAALEVFQPVGSASEVLASPPVARQRFADSGLYPASLAYFNLHGRKDEPAWFGQCDPRRVCDETYPAALHPQDVGRFERAPLVVFSEACYGAHLTGRASEESVALQFLAHGSQAVVASTTLAYGSLNRDLIAADLLGQLFWQRIRQGMPAGEALRQARFGMAAQAHDGQKTLAAEDRKTLISFVLYGDPMARVQPLGALPKDGARSQPVVLLPGLVDGDEAPDVLSPQVEAQVRHVLETYLPAMQGASIKVRQGLAAVQAKGETTRMPVRKVVILHKAGQFARLTLDERDRLLRLAVSR
ncbi:MAG: hypothetical protein Fur0018_16660 [Anaerolineales bacterium]